MISSENKKTLKSRGILLLIILNIVLLFLFIWQAFQSSAQHLQVSQNVMRDYSSMAAQQFIRKFKGKMGYWGFHDLSLQLNSNLNEIRETLSVYLKMSNNELKPQQLHIRNGIESIYLYSKLNQSTEWLFGNQVTIKSNILKSMDLDAGKPFQVIHPDNSQGLLTMVYFPLDENHFTLVEFKKEFVKSTLDLNTKLLELLPSVLAQKINDSGGIFLKIKAPNRETFFYHHGTNTNPYLLSETIIGDDYGGLFKGYSIYAAIDESLAESLIIGGMPHNQIPKLLLLIIITLFTLLVSLWMYRREKQLAFLRSQFVARVSHELRTPLTQIRMFSETLLLNRVKDKQTTKHYLEIIHRESKRLTIMVNNILNKHQIDQQLNPVKFINVNLKQELIFACEVLQQALDKKDMNLQINIDESIEVKTDENRFKQIIINLMDNAIKYGADAQTIVIDCEVKGGFYCLSICDRGPGVPKNKQKLIWQAYQRLNRDEKRGINGTGIGLSITAENLKSINGHYKLRNRENGGACFKIYLPVSQIV